jgi:primosomal protein N' (replication factor Y)
MLRCHNCGRRLDARETCPDVECKGPLRSAGLAIQRLEEELHSAYPHANLLRLDRDTMKRRADYQAALDAFEARRADLMIGTQMVAKGLDFPHVRLVGVIDADAALYIPDFRAGERVFHLIMQVVGRAGRRKGQSLALVQTQDEPPPVIVDAVRMDFEGFAARELLIRKRLRLPPYVRMARLILADERPGRTAREAGRVASALLEAAGRVDAEIVVDRPQACPVARRRELIRWEITIRAARTGSLHRLLEFLDSEKSLRPVVKRFSVDIDPLDFS